MEGEDSQNATATPGRGTVPNIQPEKLLEDKPENVTEPVVKVDNSVDNGKIQNSISTEKPTEGAASKSNNGKHADTSNKKSSRDEKYSRRKDERSVEQVLRALNALESPQDKLAALCKKYADVIDENRKLQVQVKNIERRLIQVEREKDTAQSEYSKAVLTRSRLEGLCRELQRQNKAIKDESLLKIREEEEKRKEVSNKFQSTLAEITSLMQQNNEKNTKLRDDNIEMTTKFKSVCEQYELRVQQVEKISKQMQLEAQLADAKLAKARLEGAAEKEELLRDKQELLVELAQYQARCQELQQTETDLRGQIELYTSKYDEFQNALSRSNQVFGGFKGEMDKMSKKIVKLEKETSTWKLRWEKSHQALLEMAADKQQRDAELALANRQSTQLHKLCRTLTEERAKLMAQINSNRGVTVDSEKKDKEAVDIAEDRQKLNETLDNLQAVLLERDLLYKQQQLEKQQHQLQQELLKQQNARAQEETSSVTAQTSTKPNDKKKGKKQKHIHPTEEKSVSPPCNTKASAVEASQQCSSKTLLKGTTMTETSTNEVQSVSLAPEAEELIALPEVSKEIQLSSTVGVNTDGNAAEADDEDCTMPSLESCSSDSNEKSADLLKADAISLVEPHEMKSSDPIPIVAPFSYAAALASKPSNHGTEKLQDEGASQKSLQEGRALPSENSQKDEVCNDCTSDDSPAIVAQTAEIHEDISIIDSAIQSMILSSSPSAESDGAVVQTEISYGEQKNLSPESKKGKEFTRRKNKK